MEYVEFTKEQLIKRILELEKQIEKLQEQAAFDGLTKISNQRTLLNYLNCKIAEASNTKHPLCIALFDIDDFKRINDSKGHVYGNLVLTRVASIIQDNIREADLAGRFGGDEFMVILTNTDLTVAKSIAERIRQVVEATVFADGLRVTISGGVRQYNREAFLDFIHVADMNLYKAKWYGKNRIR